MFEIVRFYVNEVGDRSKVKRWLKKITNEEKFASHPVYKQAAQLSEQITLQEQKYASLTKQYQQIRMRAIKPGSRDSQEDQITLRSDLKLVEELLKSEPDYHGRHELHYLAGFLHSKLHQPYRADKAFQEALTLKPAMSLYLPAEKLQSSARSQWQRSLGNTFSISASAATIIILLCSFIYAKPWRWFSLKYLGLFFLFASSWAIFYWGLIYLLASNQESLRVVNNDNFFTPPTYVEMTTSAPGGELLEIFFLYGSLLAFAVFCFALFTRAMQSGILSMGCNFLFTVFAASGILFLFYFQHCDLKGQFYAENDNRLLGYLAFRLGEPEPYLLTNPTAYPVIELDSINDPELVRWLKRYQK